MNILAIDTAGKTAAVAVMRDDTLLYEMASNTGLTHSETLLPMVDTALKACGLTPAQLDLYAVTNGPGSFTGLRIGLAAVKGLAFAANTPCAGVSTMAALAYGVCGEGTVIGAQYARRGQVYWAGFDLATHARLTPDAAEPVTALEAFVKECKKPLIFVGDGAALCYNTYKDQPGILPCPQPLRVLRGAGVALAGKAMWDAGTCVSPAELLPDYHRLSQAERERAEREAISPSCAAARVWACRCVPTRSRASAPAAARSRSAPSTPAATTTPIPCAWAAALWAPALPARSLTPFWTTNLRAAATRSALTR